MNKRKKFREMGIRDQMQSIVAVTIIMLVILCAVTNVSIKQLVYRNMDEHVDSMALRLSSEIELTFEKIKNFCISIGEDEAVQALMRSDYSEMSLNLEEAKECLIRHRILEPMIEDISLINDRIHYSSVYSKDEMDGIRQTVGGVPFTWLGIRQHGFTPLQGNPEMMVYAGDITVGNENLGTVVISIDITGFVAENEKGMNARYFLADRDGVLFSFNGSNEEAEQIWRIWVPYRQEERIEKDVVLQTSQSAEEKFLTGKNAAIQYDGGFGGEYSKMSSLWKEYHENDYTEDVKALRLMPDQNGNKTYPVWGYAWSESYINANVGQEKLDRILQLYDYLLSDEGAFFTSYGPEGELYEIVDGKVQMYDDGAIVSDKYPSCGVLGILVRWNPSSYDDRFAAGIPEAYNQVNYDLAREAKAVKIPDHENECIQIMREKKIDFGIKNESDFLRIMTGTEPVEEMWEEIYEEYEEKGLQKVIDTVNGEMQRREK